MWVMNKKFLLYFLLYLYEFNKMEVLVCTWSRIIMLQRHARTKGKVYSCFTTKTANMQKYFFTHAFATEMNNSFFIVFYSLSFCSLHHSLASTTFSFTKWKCPFSQFLCILFVWSPLKIATFMTNNNIDNDDRRTNRYILVTYLCHFFRYLLACCMNNVVLFTVFSLSIKRHKSHTCM